jgi:hypothetical protein
MKAKKQLLFSPGDLWTNKERVREPDTQSRANPVQLPLTGSLS